MRNYTDEQMKWLAQNAKGSTWASLTESFNKLYGTAHSVQRVKTHCNRHGIYVQGELAGKSCWNVKPIGHICPTANGYARVKTADGYKMLARVTAPIELDSLVCCHFDGDRLSAAAEYHTAKAMRRYALNCRYNKGYRAYRQTAMQICEIEVQEKEIRDGKSI